MGRRRGKDKSREGRSHSETARSSPRASRSGGVSPGRRKRAWALIVLALIGAGALAVWWLGFRAGSEVYRPMNVVIVTADTLRADKLACYGNRRIATPNIDGMAASGVLFESATTVVPLTLPAHSSIFTGTYPVYHGVRDNGGYYLDSEQVTLAETLKAKGYATGAFVGAFVLDSRWGLNQGFDRYFDDFDLSKFEKVSLDTVQRRGDEVLEQALNWMDSVREQRFFSWIHFYDAHTPYQPPEPFLSQYRGVRWGRYDGEVAYVDSLMGELLTWLEEKKLTESTIVAFIGDHGESLGEHHEVTHGYFIYDATVHVPFILKTPYLGLRGRRVAAQVRSIDLMPTLLELLAAEIPAPVQGESLLDLATGRVGDLSLVAYSESYYPRHHYGWSELKSLRNGAFHFIDAPRPELFDLEVDPREHNNLAPQRAATVRQFADKLEEIRARYSAEGVEERAPATLDPETQARLAALGYLGGPSKVKIDPSKPLADPKDKIGLFNLIKDAGADSSEGKVDDALDKIQHVLAEDPDILEAHSILGNLYVKKEQTDEAIRAYQAALARDPEYKPALFGLATTYKEVGRWDDAVAGFERILDLDPRDNRAYYMLAKIHAEREEFAPALELLKKAVDVGSERAPLHNLMAECYIGLKQLDEAEAEVKQALEMKPDLPNAYFNLALIREERRDIPGAIEAYEKELEITPKNFRTHFNLAKLYGNVGRTQKMVEHFKKSIELNDKFAVGHLYLAKHYLDRGDLEQALELAKRGIELGPEPSMAPLGHFILVDVYNRLGRFQEAERELAVAQKLQGS
ncbi:MAG: sulfatase-like hydrolase/transferase [Acidobacteriota bacterium]